MAMGMPRKEFWYGETWAAVEYRRAYDLRLEQESQFAWLQGLYFFDGVSVAISNALRKKGTRAQDYIKEPIRITPLSPQEKAAKERAEQNKIIAYFSNLERASDRENEAARASMLLSADGSEMIICPHCDTYQTRRSVCMKCKAAL